MIPINGEQLEIWIASFLWPFIRILAMLATAPVFDNRTVQRRTWVGLAALIAILMMPLLPAPPVLSSVQAIPVLIQQILIGLVFLVIDGHLLVIAAVVQSFELIPVSANMTVVNSQNIAQAGSIMFMLALQISLPVMAAVLISNIVLGILARAAPQLNVMSIGFSITIGVGLWILWVSLPYFIAGIDGAIGRLLSISVLNTS